MQTERTKLIRRILFAVFALSVLSFMVAPGTSAAPSKEDVEQAKARLDSLNGELSVLVEQYNLARIRLNEVETRLQDARALAARADARAENATEAVNANASDAYMGFQSQMWS